MFIRFFIELRSFGIPVTVKEWLTLVQALEKGLCEASLESFYYLARAILIKNETFFDRYDQAFQHFFKGVEVDRAMLDEILEGLKKVDPLELTEAEKRLLKELSLDEVLENFRKQFEEGHFKEHVGGDKAIGTGGRSTQGAFGYNPAGVRIGQGESRHGRAIQIAEKRKFRNYSSSHVLDTRTLRVALTKLRTLLPEGPEDVLDLDSTIDKTCKNAGDLELVWKRDRRNRVKLALFMDVGGSMEPYQIAVSKLFSAAKSQIRDLKYFYFHNCIYQDIWDNIEMGKPIPTKEAINSLSDDYKLIFVGDASMAPSELLDVNGCIEYFYNNDVPGIWWMHKWAAKFKSAVWLNPIPPHSWNYSMSTRIINKVFPMYPLTIDGLGDAIKKLLKPSRPIITNAEIQSIVSARRRPYYY